MADLERTKTLIEKVVADEGLELVEVEYKGSRNSSLLRIYIDKPGGVTHEDCALISHQVGTLLDVEELVAGSYTLEVSSPGLTRKLTQEADYTRYQGRLVKIQMNQPVDGNKHFRGTLLGMEGTAVAVELKNGQQVKIPFQSIAKANLDIDF